MEKYNRYEMAHNIEIYNKLMAKLPEFYELKEGEKTIFEYNNGCEIYNKRNPDVIFESIITRTYRTHNVSECHCRKIIAEAVHTGFSDMNQKSIYYDVKGKVLFIVKIIEGDGYDLGAISIRRPYLADAEYMKGYEDWKRQCKSYNDEQVQRLSTLLGITRREIYFYKNKYSWKTRDLSNAYEVLTSKFISKSQLENFEAGKFSWDRYYDIFKDEYGVLDFGSLTATVQAIETACTLLGNHPNNIHLLTEQKETY